jgi:hypothetical protein
MKITFRKTAMVILTILAINSNLVHASFVSLTNTSGNNWNIEFSPITLTAKSTIVGTADLDWLVFEDFFASNIGGTGSMIGTDSIFLKINGAVATLFNVNNFIGIYNNVGGIDKNDLFINIAQATGNHSVSAGDTIIVSQNGAGVAFSASNVPTINSFWNG